MFDRSSQDFDNQEELSQRFYEKLRVWLANDKENQRLVVLKELQYSGTIEAEFMRQALITERETLMSLNHPGIPRCYGCFHRQDKTFPDCGSFFLVLEYKPGTTLEQGFHLTLPKLQSLMQQVLAILAYAQAQSPPRFHHTMNLGDLLVEYLANGDIQVSVLNFGKAVRDVTVVEQDKWRYDLVYFGRDVVRLLSGRRVPHLSIFQRNCPDIKKHLSVEFWQYLRRLTAEDNAGGFQNALEAYDQFPETTIIAPMKVLPEVPLRLMAIASFISFFVYGKIFQPTAFDHLIDKLLSVMINRHWLSALLNGLAVPFQNQSVPLAVGLLVFGCLLLIFCSNIQFLVGLGIVLAMIGVIWLLCVFVLAILPTLILIVVIVGVLGLLFYICYHFLVQGNALKLFTLGNGVERRTKGDRLDKEMQTRLLALALVLGFGTGAALFTDTVYVVLKTYDMETCVALSGLMVSGWLFSISLPQLWEYKETKRYKEANALRLKG